MIYARVCRWYWGVQAIRQMWPCYIRRRNSEEAPFSLIITLRCWRLSKSDMHTCTNVLDAQSVECIAWYLLECDYQRVIQAIRWIVIYARVCLMLWRCDDLSQHKCDRHARISAEMLQAEEYPADIIPTMAQQQKKNALRIAHVRIGYLVGNPESHQSLGLPTNIRQTW